MEEKGREVIGDMASDQSDQNKVKLYISVTKDVHSYLKEEAKKTGLSMADVAALALYRWYEKETLQKP